MTTLPELSIILPCYNEARGVQKILDRFAEVGKNISFELILVNNGSTDNTAQVLEELLPQYPFARAVLVEINQGYGHGIFTGLQAARASFLAWSHADLQTDPADVFRAWEALQTSGSPTRILVKGRRHGRKLQEKLISLGMQALATLILRVPLQEINAQPKIFHRSLLAELPDPPVDFNFDLYVLYRARRAGWRFLSIPVKFPPREYGQSNWAANWRSRVRTIARSIRYMLCLARRE